MVERQFAIEGTDQVAVLIEFQRNTQAIARTSEPPESTQSATPEGALDGLRAANMAGSRALAEQLQRLGVSVVQTYDYLPYMLVRLKKADLDGLSALDGIAAVSPNLESKAQQRKVATSVSDPQSDENPERAQLSVSTDAIKARDAWARGYDGNNQVVAVLDDGIYRSHEMFQGGGIVTEACFSASVSGQSLCPNNATQVKSQTGAASACAGGNQVCEHGTHVAGIVMGFTAPWTDNSRNAANTRLGVAPQGYVLPIQVFTRKTSGCDSGSTCLSSFSSDQLAAMNYLIDVINQKALAAPKQLVAINMSLGGDPDYSDYCYTNTLATAIRTLRQLGVLTTISSGNDSTNDRVSAPACIKDAITVDASTRDNTDGVSYSNSSRTVDILAPGGSSSGLISSAGTATPTTYVGKQGTSMAAPHVAGAIAILRSKNPNATADQVEWALKKGATRSLVYSQEYKTWPEYFLDVNAAIDALGSKTALGVPIAGYYPSAFTGGFNYVRVFNPGTSSGTVNVTLVRDDAGEILGTTPLTVPARATIQVQLSTLQESIGGTALNVPGSTTLSVYFDSSFLGYAQNILWNAGAQSLTNITSCADNQPDFNNMLGNVHTALIDASYPSSIRIHNKGPAAARAVFDIYNATTGALLGRWTTPDAIAANTTKMYTAMSAYAAIGYTPDASTYHTSFVLRSDPAFVIGHVVNNVGANVMTDMTPKCRI